VAWSVAWYIDETTYPMKDQAYFDGEQELADAWERGYNDQWHIQQEHLREASSIAEIWNSNKETTT
jgi:hypothetical protein